MEGLQGRRGCGRGGRINRHGKGNGDTGGILEAAAWAPTLAVTGNPSDGEMEQLLTREIKSGRDGEYLYAHLLTPRGDASSQRSAAKSHLS